MSVPIPEDMQTTTQLTDATKGMLLEEINRERKSDFPQLRRVPSTHALKVLRYFDTLNAESADVFCDALAESAFDSLFPEPGSVPLYKRNPAYRKYVDTVGKTAYLDYRGLRSYLAAARLGGKQLSPKTRERAEAIVPITAAELRKRIKLAFADVLHPMKVSHKGQYWVYIGTYDGVETLITIDYSCPHYQLNYWVTINNARPSFWGSNFERLLGLNYARWDNIDQRNADDAIHLLTAHVRYCINTLRRLPKA